MWKFYWFRDNKDGFELIVVLILAIIAISTESTLACLTVFLLWNILKFYVLWRISKDEIKRGR